LGGVLVAFLPLFSEYFAKDEKKAWEFSSNCLNVFLFLLILLSLFLFIFTPYLVKMIAPGFGYGETQKTIMLTRVMFLSPIFFGLSSIFSGILQYFDRFLIYGLCPILYNLGIIFGILFLSPKFGILGLALGVVMGAFFHFVIQVPTALSCGFNYKPIFNFKDSKISRLFILMIPRTLGVSAFQINLVVINAIASTLGEGTISIFNLANNISYFPIGIVGISFAVAAFPSLSKTWAEGGKKEFFRKFSLVFRQTLYLVFPISILIFILRNQIVDIILKNGLFSVFSAKLASSSLGLFCLGIFALALIPIVLRAFFSLKNTKTPTLIALISMSVNIFLSFILTQALKFPRVGWHFFLQKFLVNFFSLQGIQDVSVLGLALAVSFSAIFQLILLLFFLFKELKKSNP
jgi:putative peptidoglycan lipid II flippase